VQPAEVAGEFRSIRGSSVEAFAQRALVALWVGIIPALAAGLALRYLVPRAAPGGFPAIVALAGHRFGPYLAIGLFLFFSFLARHWRYWLPGGRFASALPAHLPTRGARGHRLAAWAADAAFYEQFRSPAVPQAIRSGLSAVDGAELARHLAGMREALERGDLERTLEERRAVERLARPVLAARRRRERLGLAAAVAATGVALLLLRARVVEPYQVTSTSMLPTLEQEDLIAGSKLAYAAHPPARGDVIVFPTAAVALGARARNLPGVLVKRVIGLPGDRIATRGSAPIINGWPVPSCDAGDYTYLLPDASGASVQALHGRLYVEFLGTQAYLTVYSPLAPSFDEYLVKPQEVFVLGDNRGTSLDSRAYDEGHGGGVPYAAVQAKAQRFLVGTRRSGDADFARIFAPIDRLEARLRLDGFDTDAVQARIARCLKDRPSNTTPPPGGPSVAHAP
jgi:signal peptidase I